MTDLLVVGGGPAGLATALHGARAGLEVAVVERRAGAIDKACGEGLMPHTLRHLERLGVEPKGMAINGIRYLDDHRQVDARFSCGTGRGVRRTVLHQALLDEAVSAGVQMVNERAGEITQDATSVRVNGLRARYLAAADGLHSPIRRSLGLEQPTVGPRRWGIRRHVHIAPWTDHVEVHWAGGAEAYVTPVAEDCVGVAMLSSGRGGFDSHLEEFPALRERIDGRDHDPDRAAGPLRQRVSRRASGRVLLVGDAAGYVDALTGEGIALGLAQARTLVDALVRDDPQRYETAYRKIGRRHELLTHALLRSSRVPAVRRRIVPTAARLPRVFAGVVNQLAKPA